MKVNQHILLTVTLTLLLNSTNSLWGQTSASQPVTSSGREFMVPKKEVNGKLIGQEDVLIQEVVISDSGHQYRRLDVGVSGTVDGWVVKEDLPMPQLVSAPDFIYPQHGLHFSRFHGTLRYEASKGTGMTIIYPEAGTGWNKKLFVTVHGSSGSFLEGTLQPWNRIFDPSQPLGDISKYERLMLDKGYAIAKTRRNAESIGDYSVTLDDGEILEGWNLNVHTGLILDLVQLAENLLKDRLGEKPLRTYWYGHSAGGMNGRLINYKPGENLDESGEPIIDGFLNDDSGAGLYLPVLEKNGRDTLFVTEKERRRLSPVYFINKRLNAKILREKGLGDKSRMYEVRGVSHFAGGNLSANGLYSRGVRRAENPDVVLLDTSGLLDALIDLLDNWVEQDIPPTKIIIMDGPADPKD